MYSRHLHSLRAEALQDTPVILLNGARQTGRSTLAKQVASDRKHRYLTFDDPVVLAAVKRDPAGLIDGLEGPVVLDEITACPGGVSSHKGRCRSRAHTWAVSA